MERERRKIDGKYKAAIHDLDSSETIRKNLENELNMLKQYATKHSVTKGFSIFNNLHLGNWKGQLRRKSERPEKKLKNSRRIWRMITKIG